MDPFAPSLQLIADFLCYLREEKKYLPMTIAGYRSALAATLIPLKSWGSDWNDILASLSRNFALECPRTSRVVPKWDIGLVLQFLSTLQIIDLKWLTLRTVFLVALASAARVSEIHALSSEVRHTADRKGVRLEVLPSFLAKTQVPSRKPSPVFIPAILAPSQYSVCPVRNISAYLEATAVIRQGRSPLFIPWKGGPGSLAKKRSISAWLVQVVNAAYAHGAKPPPTGVRAHDVRAMSTSLAWDRGVAITDFVEAGIWSSPSTFQCHYLRDLTTHPPSPFGQAVAASSVLDPRL